MKKVGQKNQETNKTLEYIALKPARLTKEELRVLRCGLGCTQEDFALRIGRDLQTIGRWERGEGPADQAAEIVLRVLVLQYLKLPVPSLEEMAFWLI